MEKGSPAGRQEQRDGELEKRIAELEDRLRAAEEANRAKSRFLSNMSHDIRTPMNAILGMTSIGLSHIDEKARVQDCLNKIQTASMHLMNLVNDVLDMSRIDSNRLTLSEEPFSLADLIHDISVVVRPQAAKKNQQMEIGIGRIDEEELLGDQLHLRQILVNIIGNAVKYTPDGGRIEIRFSQCPEEAGADSLAQAFEREDAGGSKEGHSPESGEEKAGAKRKVWFCFACRDNGIGMSRDFLERIFVPFERVRNEITSKIEGTGLGMSIVKNLVDLMGGQITVESEEGTGSCFTVRIPIAVSGQSAEVRNLPAGETVLVAEGRRDRAEQMAGYLEDAGLVPVWQDTGARAVTWLTEAHFEERMPCAMLIGEELADMPVLNLASHVRQLAGREFPIALVSEGDWAQMEYRAVRAGVNAFIPCPLFKSRLLDTIAELTGEKDRDAREAKQKQEYSGCHILLVEDNELNQEIALELLSMTGAQVEVADNGAQAVEKFGHSPEGHFDIIFMDIHMPLMDGYEATRRIRRMDRADAGKVWIVAMTADAFVEDVRQAKEAGMDEHISKPVEPGRLQDILYRRFRDR